MNDLVTWLRAQLDEDERVARSGAPGPWVYQDVDSVGGGRICDLTVAIAEMHYDTPGTVDPRIRRTVPSEEADATGAHIARFNPARVLAELEAKRRILDLWEASQNNNLPSDALIVLDQVVQEIAVPLADEPGYDESWRP